jgi:hypothetical protein
VEPVHLVKDLLVAITPLLARLMVVAAAADRRLLVARVPAVAAEMGVREQHPPLPGLL